MARRRAPVGVALAGCVLALLATTAESADDASGRKRRFDIPAGPLSAGVLAFSRQSDIQVIAAGDLSRKTNGRVRGDLEPGAALSALVQGQGLTADAVAGGFILRPAAAAKPAPADRTEPVELPEVVVTGYRRSLGRAQAQKREALVEEDVILSEDIAAFPDLNLAESLQRIPGITIDRDSGEGRQISLRGLQPDFTRTQLDGMEVLGNTASGMDNRGGVSRTRAFDYSLFASELFEKVTVLKSYSADLDEGGIGGTVQLETAQPFDFPGFKGVLSVKGQENSNTGSVRPRLAGLLSNRWGPFGALVSLAYSANDSNEYGYRNWGWSRIKVSPADIGPKVSAADAALMESGTVYAPQADTYSSWYDHRTRLGATLSLQYQPDSNFKLGFDALYSRLANARKDYALAAAGVNALTGDISGTQVLESAVIRGDTLEAANYTGVNLRSEYNTEYDSTDFSQAVLHGAWRASDSLLLKGQVGVSRSDYELPYFDKVFLESKAQAFGFNDLPSMPVNTYGFNINDPSQWNLMRMDTQANAIISAYTNGKLDADYALNSFSNLEVGVEYRRFSNQGAQYNNKVFHDTPTDTPIPANLKLSVPYDSLAPYIVGDVGGTYAYIGQTRNIESAAYLSPGSNYSVLEATTAAYVQYDLNAELWGYRVKANTGVRYYTTALTSVGAINTGSALSQVSINHSYNGFLPAANLAVYVRPDLVARLSANRDISRPALGSLAAAGTITTAPTFGTLSIGNPNLKPFTADEVEGSIEYYESHVGFFSAGLFYKRLNSFISEETSVEPYSATGYPLSFLLPGQTGSVIYNVYHPVNVNGADIKGVELAFQRDFDFLPRPFNHLGVVANGTYADGQSPAIVNGVTYNLPLLSLSKYSGNATLYYETKTWGMRISEAFRGRYLDSTGDNGNIGGAYAPTNNIDFAAHYNITPTLKATFEGINVTNQHIIQYSDLVAKRTTANTSAGATILWGLSAEF